MHLHFLLAEKYQILPLPVSRGYFFVQKVKTVRSVYPFDRNMCGTGRIPKPVLSGKGCGTTGLNEEPIPVFRKRYAGRCSSPLGGPSCSLWRCGCIVEADARRRARG